MALNLGEYVYYLTANFDVSTLDPQQYAHRRLRETPREYGWTPGADDRWKTALRARLGAAIGLQQAEIHALEPEILERRLMDGYTSESLTFSSRPDLKVFAYLLIPEGVLQPAPAVICIPGHGRGVDALVGVAPEDYQRQFALQCVRAGFVTLALEPVSFGRRKAAIDSDKDFSCVRDSMAALMLGESMIGWRCLDTMAAIRYLGERPEVDSRRIATMGISGGGLVAFWTACLDQRVAAAVVSGYFNTFLDSILSIDHCVDNFAPGLSTIVEMPDMAALIAPRKLFVESAREDPIFPAESFAKACLLAEAIYADEGVADSFAADLFEGGHEFSGRRSIPKLAEWFGLMG